MSTEKIYKLWNLCEIQKNSGINLKKIIENKQLRLKNIVCINNKELVFDILSSSYKIGSAKSQGVGRSETIQLFHGSEVAYWAHATTHISGILQAVPDMEGTEIIFLQRAV